MDSRLLTGAVEMLVLDVLARGPNYGYAVTQSVLDQSRGYFQLKEGSLYPALHRMERQGWVSSYWVDTDEGRRRKYYKITSAGQKALGTKRQEWARFTEAVNGVLGAAIELA